MFGAVILIFLLYFINQPILGYFKKRHRFISLIILNKLYFYHIIFWGIYTAYASTSSSDSVEYYLRSSFESPTRTWLDLYGTGTPFISFIAYPFVSKLGFTYDMAMVLFAWLGYLGFLYFYVFFKEHVKYPLKFKGYDLIILILFLPNMHFWTSSLGKGSIIFLGIGMFAYAMKEPQKRFIPLLIGSLIVYNVRPHMFMFLSVGAVLGYLTGQEKVPFYQKALVYLAFVGGGILLYDQIFAFAHINEEDVLGSFQEFSTAAAGRLSDSGSGIDINNYSLPMKLFTFWFRPLFFDAPGVLGLYISVENVFYLILTFKLFNKDFIPFLKRSSSLVKMSLVVFISSSIALSFVMSNLGIVIRQKSMVMYFLFFVILAFMEYKQRKKSRSVEGSEINPVRKQLRLI